MNPAPPWYTPTLRLALRFSRALWRRLARLRPPEQPDRYAGPQANQTGLRRYAERRRLGTSPALAAADATRECLDVRNLAGALRLGYTLLADPDTAEAGHAVLGAAHARSSAPAQAWAEFAKLTEPAVIAAFGTDYFPSGFQVDAQTTTELAGLVLDEVPWPGLPAAAAVTIAQHAFSVGALEVTRRYLAAFAEGRLGPDAAVRQRLDRLASWLPEARRAVPELPADLRFGVLDHRQPDHRSSKLGDYLQSLAGLGLLVRRHGLSFVGDPELAGFAEELAGRIKPGRELDGPRRVIHLVQLQREATGWQDLPEPTWAVMAGWYSHRTFSDGWGLPFHPHLRPILLSFHLANAETLTEEVIAYLRRYGPVGGRDWQTVALLRAAGVPSFFSGCLAATIDTLFPDAGRPDHFRTASVDLNHLTRAEAKGDLLAEDDPGLRDDPLVANLRRARDWAQRFHTDYSDVVTTRLPSYLAARALGCRVRFEPDNPSDLTLGGLLDLDEPEFAAMRDGLLDKTGRIVAALLAGADEDTVYALWRELCAPDVAAADRFLGSFSLAEHALPEPSVPAPLSSRLIVIDAPVRSEPGVARLLDSLAEQAPTVPVVLVGAAGEHATGVRWVRDLPVPERGSAQQQQALLVASVLNSLPPGVRVLLLPSDAVVRGPVDRLFEIDLAGAALAAREEVRRDRGNVSTVLRRLAKRQARGWQDALVLLAAGHARCGHGPTTFDARVAVIDADALRASDFPLLSRDLIEDFGASLSDALNLILRGRRAPLAAMDASNVALETPPAGATVISGLSQARMGAHWFA